MSQRSRKLLPFLVSFMMGSTAFCVVVWESVCTHGMVSARGTVTRSFTILPMMGVRAVHARPQTFADVAYDFDGKRVVAELVVWNHPLKLGQSVPILYARDRSSPILLNEIWALRSGSILASLAAGLAIFWDTWCLRDWKNKQRHPLLRD